MADEDVLDQLREVARKDGVSLAEVIRQGTQMRAKQSPRRFRFVGAGSSTEPPFDMSERASNIEYEPRSWR